MLIEIIAFLFLGMLAGTFSGLIPGIHINLVGAALVSFSYLIAANPILLAVFITAMAITHTFIDFIPSIFLGCPETDTALSVLPGHQMLKKGRAYEAIMLTAHGCLAAIFLLLILSFPLAFIFSHIYNQITFLIPYILILVILSMIFLEKNKFSAIVVVALTGILGLLTLNIELNQPLLPLLSGLFGSSSLILSLNAKTKIPKQIISFSKYKIFKPLLGAIIASPLCGFLPGLGSGQAAIIGNFFSKTNNKGFLILLGATNTLVMGFSFVSLYAIAKARTGAAVAVQSILGIISLKILILLLIVSLITGILSFFLTKILAKFLSKNIEKINYSILSTATLIFLTILVGLISGWTGLFIFITSTLTGIYCINTQTKRTNMMGCLLIPTIVLYLL